LIPDLSAHFNSDLWTKQNRVLPFLGENERNPGVAVRSAGLENGRDHQIFKLKWRWFKFGFVDETPRNLLEEPLHQFYVLKHDRSRISLGVHIECVCNANIGEFEHHAIVVDAEFESFDGQNLHCDPRSLLVLHQLNLFKRSICGVFGPLRLPFEFAERNDCGEYTEYTNDSKNDAGSKGEEIIFVLRGKDDPHTSWLVCGLLCGSLLLEGGRV
jgi:hypothetical protein